MIIGKVVGNVWATRKDEALKGFKLLVVKPLDEYSERDLPSLVATDTIGAGIGDQVLVVKGSSASRAINKNGLPIDATIVGIIDDVEIEDD